MLLRDPNMPVLQRLVDIDLGVPASIQGWHLAGCEERQPLDLMNVRAGGANDDLR